MAEHPKHKHTHRPEHGWNQMQWSHRDSCNRGLLKHCGRWKQSRTWVDNKTQVMHTEKGHMITTRRMQYETLKWNAKHNHMASSYSCHAIHTYNECNKILSLFQPEFKLVNEKLLFQYCNTITQNYASVKPACSFTADRWTDLNLAIPFHLSWPPYLARGLPLHESSHPRYHEEVIPCLFAHSEKHGCTSVSAGFKRQPSRGVKG